jgi:phenol hydroxylase P0 protein
MSIEPRFNPAEKFVKVTDLRSDGFVEFEFAIGEPELFVELILPAAMFDEFCRVNSVIFLDAGVRAPAIRTQERVARSVKSLASSSTERSGPSKIRRRRSS